MDTGAVSNIISSERVQDTPLVAARRRRRFVTADGSPLAGGDKGLYLDLKVPLLTRRGKYTYRTFRTFFYVASISVPAILGYEFYRKNHIAVAPSKSALLDVARLPGPQSDIPRGKQGGPSAARVVHYVEAVQDSPTTPASTSSSSSLTPSRREHTVDVSKTVSTPCERSDGCAEPMRTVSAAPATLRSQPLPPPCPSLRNDQNSIPTGQANAAPAPSLLAGPSTSSPPLHSLAAPASLPTSLCPSKSARGCAVSSIGARGPTMTPASSSPASSAHLRVVATPTPRSTPGSFLDEGGGIREQHSFGAFFAIFQEFEPVNSVAESDSEGPKWIAQGYQILQTWFERIKEWSHLDLTIDAFASRQSYKLPRWWDRTQDALSQPWGDEVLWINPPIAKIPDIVMKIVEDEAQGVMILPIRDTVWFRALCFMARDWMDLPTGEAVFEDCEGNELSPLGWSWRAVHFNAYGLRSELEKHHPQVFEQSLKAFEVCEDTLISYVGAITEVNSVIEIGSKDESAEVKAAREEIEERFSHVLLDKEALKKPRKPDPAKRGPFGTARIELKPDAEPSKSRPIRLHGERLEGLRGKVEEFLSMDWIEEAPASEWGAPAFVVPKPDGSWRVVIDYRSLNGKTKTDTFPLPIIEDCIARQGLCKIWSIMDAAQGFHQMELEETSRQYTAFTAGGRVYQWKVMPMGIKNGPAMFQRLMSWALREQSQADCYVDDVITGSTGHTHAQLVESHKRDIAAVLEALARADIVMKKAKTELFVTEVKFCGHVLSGGTRRPAPSKLAALEQWDPKDITTVTHLRSFLGLCQWYEIYIPDYAKVAAPLTDALKGVEKSKRTPPVHMTQDMIDAVNTLKSLLKNHVVLDVVDPSKPFIIRVDASGYAIGGVLEQEPTEGGQPRPIAFFSRKLTGNMKDRSQQCGWTPREQETYALVIGLAKFQSWIGGQQVIIKAMTDHKALESWYSERLDCKSGPLGRRGRWHEFFSRFPGLEVRYVPGKDNTVADYLSRWAYPACEVANDETFHGSREDARQVQDYEAEEAALDSLAAHLDDGPIDFGQAAIFLDKEALQAEEPHQDALDLVLALNDASSSSTDPQMNSREQQFLEEEVDTWVTAYKRCPVLSDKYAQVTDPDNAQSLGGLSFERGRLRRGGRILVPTSLTETVIRRQHHVTGHPGIPKMLAALQRRYWFACDRTDLIDQVTTIVRGCAECQVAKPATELAADERLYHPIPATVFSSLSMDFVALPTVVHRKEELDQALVIVDRTSGFLYAHPCNKRFTGRDVAQVFYDRLFHFTGLPNEIFTAGDATLANAFFNTVCALSGVDRAVCTRYRPNSNGRVERAVQSVVIALRKSLLEYGRTWPEVLPMAVYTINTIPGVLNDMSPWEIVFGRVPIGLGDIPSLDTEHLSLNGETWATRMKNLHARVAKRVTALHEAEAKRYNRRRQPPQRYKVGDRVLVRLRDHERNKLDPLWTGPCLIVQRVHEDTYIVSVNSTDRQVTNTEIKPWSERPHDWRPLFYFRPRGRHANPSPSSSSSSSCPPAGQRRPAIMMERRGEGSARRIRIRWSGCGPEEDTWEKPDALYKFFTLDPTDPVNAIMPRPPSCPSDNCHAFPRTSCRYRSQGVREIPRS